MENLRTLAVVTLRWALMLSLAASCVSRLYGAEKWLYWAHTSGIGRVTVDGTEASPALIDGFQIEGVAASATRDQLLWGDVPPTVPIGDSGLLQTSRLDGSGVERLVGQLPHPGAVAWDEVHDLVYWTDLEKNEIQRAGADGAGVDTVLAERDEIRQLGGIAADPQRNALYFGYVNPLIDSLFPGAIARLDLNDGQLDNVVTGLSAPQGLALHDGNLYWADKLAGAGGVIGRFRLTTGERDLIVEDLGTPVGVAVDPTSELIYWTDRQAGKLQRAELDGSNLVDVLADLNAPGALSLAVPEPAAWLLLASAILLLAAVRFWQELGLRGKALSPTLVPFLIRIDIGAPDQATCALSWVGSNEREFPAKSLNVNAIVEHPLRLQVASI